MKLLREPAAEGAEKLITTLLQPLKQGKQVLWMISGGSNITLAVEIMKRLHGHEKGLMVTLVDERYGPVGHADSNWQQLIKAGFDGGKAQLFPVLQEGLSMEATSRMFELTLQDCFAKADVTIAQLGMGGDGHTSGILPHSPATQPTAKWAVCYETPQYNRVTTTFAALKALDKAFCFAYGADKKQALRDLEKEVSLETQPAQIFKQMHEVRVYNDQIGKKE